MVGALCSVNHLVELAQRKCYTGVVIICCLTHLESVLWLPESHTTELLMYSNALFWMPKKVETDVSVVSSVVIVDHKQIIYNKFINY